MIPTFCIPCDQLKLVYVQVPKAANSSIIYCLNKSEDWFDLKTKNHQELQDKIRSRKICFNRGFYENYKNLLWFTFVRNPYQRILSSYINKVLEHSGEFLPFLSMGINQSTTFLEFCSIIKDFNPELLNDHIKPQCLIVPDCMNFVGKIENIKKDWSKLKSKVSGLTELDIQMNKSKTVDNLLCKDSINIINQIYSNDFERFNYNKL